MLYQNGHTIGMVLKTKGMGLALERNFEVEY